MKKIKGSCKEKSQGDERETLYPVEGSKGTLRGVCAIQRSGDTIEDVPHPGDKIHIPLTEREAVRLLGKVKPTIDMPRPGATGKPKRAPRKKRNK
ncbi:MAG: hypothetical protein JO033_04915 [Acidobacteriaceae bacterium]|nr:hypothetical protein [Acidobacteriaceae bacterium]MBV9498673.1 hypothetical protein [Acidobacteriaceae bacterium]